MTTSEQYGRAAIVSRHALGKVKVRGKSDEWVAEQDPLAWHLLTEVIAEGFAYADKPTDSPSSKEGE